MKKDIQTYEIKGNIELLEKVLRFEISGTTNLLPKTPSSEFFISNSKGEYLDIKKKEFCFINFSRSSLKHSFSYCQIDTNNLQISSNLSIKKGHILVKLMITIFVSILIGGAFKSILYALLTAGCFWFFIDISAILEFYFHRNMCREISDKKVHKISDLIKINMR